MEYTLLNTLLRLALLNVTMYGFDYLHCVNTTYVDP